MASLVPAPDEDATIKCFVFKAFVPERGDAAECGSHSVSKNEAQQILARVLLRPCSSSAIEC